MAGIIAWDDACDGRYRDREAPGKAEARARYEYSRETDNHPTIHTNRFPSWEELPAAERKRRIAAA